MRTIGIEEIIKKNIPNDSINKNQPKHVLARSLCVKMLANAKNEVASDSINSEPQKDYEIYKINFKGKDEIFIAKRKFLPEAGLEDGEIFYNRNIAFEAYSKMNSLSNNALTSCEEIVDYFETDMYEIEDEINEFLHQEVTWQSFKNFLFKEVEVTHRGKRIL